MKAYLILTLVTCTTILDAHIPFNPTNLQMYTFAQYHQHGGNTGVAREWYNEISRSRGSVYTNKGYIRNLFNEGKFKEIADRSDRLEESFKDDPDMLMLFAVAHKKSGQNKKADEKLLALAHKFKTHPDIVLQATNTLVERKELGNAILLVDEYLNNGPQRPSNYVFNFLKAQIYTRMNKLNEALQELEKCFAVHPHFDKGQLLQAVIHEQMGQLDKAIKGFTIYLETADDQSVRQHLIQLALRQQTAQQNKQVILVNMSCFEKALTLFQQKRYPEALAQIDRCLTQKPNDPDNRILKIQILSSMGRPREAINLLAIWVNAQPSNHQWLKPLHVLALSHPAEQEHVIATLKTLAAKHANQVEPGLYLADLYLRTKQIDSALAIYEPLLNKTDNKQTQTKLLYQIAGIYTEKQNYEKSRHMLEKAYTIDSTFLPVINALAYYYATKGKQIDRAEKLMEQVLQKEQNNAHYLDTVAVILYKRKQYEKASTLLQTIIDKYPHDPTLLIHWAKVLYKLDKSDEARTLIVQAHKRARNDYEKRTSKKLLERWKQ